MLLLVDVDWESTNKRKIWLARNLNNTKILRTILKQIYQILFKF